MADMGLKGLVLAGGKSRRFGTDKALAMYDGETLLERAVSLLLSVGLEPVVVTRREASYMPVNSTLLVDSLPDRGPLGGIYTAMDFFRNTAFLVLSCDMPALTPMALSALLSARDTRNRVTLFCADNGEIQPFPGIYEPTLFQTVCEKIFQDELSMHGLLESVSDKKLAVWEGEPAIFANVNRQEDLAVILSAKREESQSEILRRSPAATSSG